jgi:hypothetical protein
MSIMMTTSLLVVVYNIAVVKDEIGTKKVKSLNEFYIPFGFNLCLTIGYSLYFSGLEDFALMGPAENLLSSKAADDG